MLLQGLWFICVLLHSNFLLHVGAELIRTPQNAIAFNGAQTKFHCSSNLTAKDTIGWSFSEANNYIYGGVRKLGVVKFFSGSGDGNHEMTFDASVVDAGTYFCIAGPADIASAELTVIEAEAEPNYGVHFYESSILVNFSAKIFGKMIPMMNCEQWDEKEKSYCPLMEGKTINSANNSVPVWRFATTDQSNRIICSAYFKPNLTNRSKRSPGQQATNCPKLPVVTVYEPPPAYNEGIIDTLSIVSKAMMYLIGNVTETTIAVIENWILILICSLILFLLIMLIRRTTGKDIRIMDVIKGCCGACVCTVCCFICWRCIKKKPSNTDPERSEMPIHRSMYYIIRSNLSGLVLGVDGGKTAGMPVFQFAHHGGPSQQWRDDPTTGTIRSSLGDHLCMDIDGDRLVLDLYLEGKSDQLWVRRGREIANSEDPTMVLDIEASDKTAGAKVMKNKANGGENQSWTFELV